MTSQKWKAFALHSVLAVAGVLGGVFAHAEMMVEKSVMVSTSSAHKIETLGLSAAGRWSVTVTDLGWPGALQSLSFAITNVSGVLVSRTGAGTLVFDVVSPVNLFANVYAPTNAGGTGLYHLSVAFTPAVPLPAAGWLLISGMLGLAGLRRKHATVTNSVV